MKVNLKCTLIVSYDQEIEVSEEEYKAIQEEIEDDDEVSEYFIRNGIPHRSKAFDIISDRINYDEWLGVPDTFSDVEVNKIKTYYEGKATED